MCKMTTQTYIRVEFTLKEAEDVIVDPSNFVSQLQDMLPAPSLDRVPREPRIKKARRKGFKQPKKHCEECGRNIGIGQWQKHLDAHTRKEQAA